MHVNFKSFSLPGVQLHAFALLLASVACSPLAGNAQETQALTSPKTTPKAVIEGSAKLIEPLDANQKLRVLIALRPPKQAEEEQFIRDLQTKGTPSFGKFLTQEQWNERFAPSAKDEQAVVDWAKSQGFTITNRYSNRLLVDVEAPVATVEKALSVKMNRYMVSGNARFSNDRDPVIPANMIGIIQNVQGLNNVNMMHAMRKGALTPNFPIYTPGPAASEAIAGGGNASAPKPKSLMRGQSNGVSPNISNGAYDPTDIYSSQAYDVQALYNQGHCCNPLGNSGSTPKETSIAIVTAGAQDPNDFEGFHNSYPYLADHWVMVGIDGQTVPCNPKNSSCDGEGTMDFEWSTAMSNSFGSLVDTSLVIMYDASDSGFGTFDDAYNRVLSDNTTRILSTSWGCAEYTCYDDDDMNTTHNIFNNLVGTGWTLVAAAGDVGPTANCDAVFGVGYPASDPDMVAAGGTTLTLDSAGNYVRQTVWEGGPDGCSTNDGGTTGGPSQKWGVPGYQSGLGLLSRGVPDLALNADWFNTPQNFFYNGFLQGNGGTSIVAPELAGIFAQLNAYLLTLGNNCQNVGGPCAPMGGLFNSMVYFLGENPKYAPHYLFYDIIIGCNDNDVTAAHGLPFFCAGKGYDMASGWGSFNALQLAWGINTYRAGDFGAPVVAFSGPPHIPEATNWFNTDQTISWTVTDVSGLSGFAPNGVAGFSQAWDASIFDANEEAFPGIGGAFVDGPQFPNATSGAVNLSSAGQGCHSLTVHAWDNSGFSNGDNVFEFVCYDTIPPFVTASNSPVATSTGFNKSSVTATLNATDIGGETASGVKNTFYSIDSTACSPSNFGACKLYVGPISIAATGSHFISYFTEDIAGNFSGISADAIRIDEVPPITTASLSGTLTGSVYHTAVKVTLSAADNFSGIHSTTYSIDGGAKVGYTGPVTVSSVGSHTVKFFSQDKAGNVEATKSTSFSIASPTTATLSSSLNPSRYLQNVTFTAKVTPSLSGTATGTVTFKFGSTTLGTGTLSGGVATLTTNALPEGVSDSITASYGGAADFFASTSSALAQSVLKGQTTTTLTSSANPSEFGQSTTFTATIVAEHGGTPTGTITFKNGSTTIGTAALSGGKATLAVSNLPVGALSITAAYGGSGNYLTSTSSALTQTVKAATTVKLTSSSNPATAGSTVTFTAKVSASSGPTPTGTVTFKDGSTTLGTGSLSSGTASLSTKTLAKGTHSITAAYGGNLDDTSSTSLSLSEAIN